MRRQRVILDLHLTQLYGVPNKRLTQPAEAPKRRRIGFVQD